MDSRCKLGEGPLWHPLEHKLYWIDITLGQLFRYDPQARAHEQVYRGNLIGGFTLQADGAILLFMAEGAIRSWRQGETSSISEPVSDHRGFRFNEAIADPMGRVFSGTMVLKESKASSGRTRLLRRLSRLTRKFVSAREDKAHTTGGIYRLELDGTLTEILRNVGCPNGMGFSPDHKRIYITDSAARNIHVYHYEVEAGVIRNGRVFAHVPPGEGTPDGLTVDANGGIWSARWNGGCVVHYNSDGSITTRVELPAKKVTSVTFGGDDYDDLYITTAGGQDRAVEGPGAGAVFRVRPEIGGIPESFSRVRLEDNL